MSTQAPDRAQAQADATSVRLLALLAAWRAGQIDAPDMSRGAAVAVYASKLAVSRLADVEISSRLNRPPVGVMPDPERHLARLGEAIETILDEAEEEPDDLDDVEPEDDEDDIEAERLERLADSEVTQSYTRSLGAALTAQGARWREVVQPGACPICLPFTDREHNAEENFAPHHVGCRCKPEPLEPVGTPVLTFTAPGGTK